MPKAEIPNYFLMASPLPRTDASIYSRSVVRSASLEEHLKYTLRASILMQQGELELNPNLGSTVRELLFKPLVPNLRTELQTKIRQALQQSEPRVEVETVSVASDPEDGSRMLVDVSYRIRETRKLDEVRVRL